MNTKATRALLLTLISFTLSGCAGMNGISETFRELTGYYSLSAEQCQTADWEMLGYEDGDSGKSLGLLGKHQESCGRFGIFIDQDAYHKGYEKGRDAYIARYCTPDNGYQIGRKGKNYKNICPAELQVDFVQAYERGFDLFVEDYCTPTNAYQLGQQNKSYRKICPPHSQREFNRHYRRGQEVRELQDEIDELEEEIQDNRRELRDLKRQEYISEYTEDEIRDLRDEIDDLRDEQWRLQKHLRRLESMDLFY